MRRSRITTRRGGLRRRLALCGKPQRESVQGSEKVEPKPRTPPLEPVDDDDEQVCNSLNLQPDGTKVGRESGDQPKTGDKSTQTRQGQTARRRVQTTQAETDTVTKDGGALSHRPHDPKADDRGQGRRGERGRVTPSPSTKDA